MDYCADTLIIGSLRMAVNKWLDGSGNVGNFVTEVFNEAKFYFGKATSEWRGAVLIYIVAGSGIRMPLEAKLLMIDCLNNWKTRVKADKKVDLVEQIKLLTEIEDLKDYALKFWGGSYQWCRNIISGVVVESMVSKFWKSTETAGVGMNEPKEETC